MTAPNTRHHATVYLDPDVRDILLKIKAENPKSMSQLVNDAIRTHYVWEGQILVIFNQALKIHREDVYSRITQILDDRHAEQNKRLDEISNKLDQISKSVSQVSKIID